MVMIWGYQIKLVKLLLSVISDPRKSIIIKTPVFSSQGVKGRLSQIYSRRSTRVGQLQKEDLLTIQIYYPGYRGTSLIIFSIVRMVDSASSEWNHHKCSCRMVALWASRALRRLHWQTSSSFCKASTRVMVDRSSARKLSTRIYCYHWVFPRVQSVCLGYHHGHSYWIENTLERGHE